jgi:Holliday junction resolvase RusA-like endonuclease
MEKIITLKFDGKLISTNHAYFYDPRSKRKIMSKEGREFKKYITLSTIKQAKEIPKITKFNNYIEIEYFIYSPNVLCKDGSINMRKGDVDGSIKLLQDAIFDGLGIDDSLILESYTKQMHSQNSMTIVNVRFNYLLQSQDKIQ